MKAPACLQQLELKPDASVQDVRRAYAQRLKQLDQATQADEFQALRAAYAEALAWCEARDQGEEAAFQASQGDDVARQLFHEFVSLPMGDADSAHQRLALCLDDHRMHGLEARRLFEQLLAARLAAGWQNGHEHLFDAAMSCFNWDIDHGRLVEFGHAGALLERAIADRERFEEQTPYHLPLQLDLLDRVRAGQRPSDTDLIRTMRVLDWLILNYGHWVNLTVGARNIERWDGWHASLPRNRQSTDGAAPQPTHVPEWLAATLEVPPSQKRRHMSPGVIMMVFLLFLLGSMVFGAWLSHRLGLSRY